MRTWANILESKSIDSTKENLGEEMKPEEIEITHRGGASRAPNREDKGQHKQQEPNLSSSDFCLIKRRHVWS